MIVQKMNVHYIAVLSAVDAEEDPTPLHIAERRDGGRLAWCNGMVGGIGDLCPHQGIRGACSDDGIQDYFSCSYFQPSSSEDIRYRWVDWTMFVFTIITLSQEVTRTSAPPLEIIEQNQWPTS